jgi:alpha-ketoglutarate-dependent taurine dioxygenase
VRQETRVGSCCIILRSASLNIPPIEFSFELQPPALTKFCLLLQSKTGGDTLYCSQVANLRTLSPAMIDFLHTLKATHSGLDSLRSTKGNVLRRDPIEMIHPVVHCCESGTALTVSRARRLLRPFALSRLWAAEVDHVRCGR